LPSTTSTNDLQLQGAIRTIIGPQLGEFMMLSDLSWEECEEYLARDNRVILPIGATEAHGRHLGLGCDYLLAEAIARVAGERSGVAVAPVLAYGMSHHLAGFAGTMTLAPETLIHVLEDLLRSLYRHGFRRVLVVNGHGGNDAALRTAALVVAGDSDGLRVKAMAWWTEPTVAQLVEEVAGAQRGSHAAIHETSFLMAVKPEAVKIERIARRDAPVVPSRELVGPKAFAHNYPDAVMGLDPSRASPELGDKIFEKAIEICLQELQTW
jgi:creatinine amidohydrolase